ncbi:MAG TPA: asparaginase domain-containing protein [Paraburkholderia sp.]|uniref:asparaginase domain-containing protein n=1 Tax=Paraburkholderia sp. TaxID=1926495 RepID=UPI002ECFFD51
MRDARAQSSQIKRLACTFFVLGLVSTEPVFAQAQTQVQNQAQQQTTLPHIAVLATGGTIAGTGTSETQTTGYKPGELTADALLNSVPSLGKVAKVSGEQVSNVGSDTPGSQAAAASRSRSSRG